MGDPGRPCAACADEDGGDIYGVARTWTRSRFLDPASETEEKSGAGVVRTRLSTLKPRYVLAVVLVAAYAVVVIRTAWISDDAYITLRTVSNVLDGYGLRWNVAERVQSYTHPLWLALLTFGTMLAGGEPYFATLILGCALSVVVVWRLVITFASSASAAIAAALLMLGSRSIVDYSTSGLENPLSHLLFVLFASLLLRPAVGRRDVGTATFIVSLAALTRLDSLLLYAPAYCMLMMRAWEPGVWRQGLLGSLPLLAWECFSLLYYGFGVPNTAFAKLATGVPRQELMAQGVRYLHHTLVFDPVTATTICAGLVAAWSGDKRLRAIGLGLFSYLAYVVWIGGDFMEGRFLSLPCVAAVLVLLRCPVATSRRSLRGPHLALAAIALCVVVTPEPPMLTGPDFGQSRVKHRRGIADERKVYFQATGLFRTSGAGPRPSRKWIMQAAEKARRAALEKRRRRGVPDGGAAVVRVWGASGMRGYYAGPDVHVIDKYGLSDPLLARMPIRDRNGWRIGHFRRKIPKGYRQSIRRGDNRIKDRDLAEYYDLVRAATRGPLLSAERFVAILSLNTTRRLAPGLSN
ncbi:MAG: hypothetical protein OXU20_17935 [Myxococcales bacterium]|nr:hypothetical protein [Myxococcales bacterium]